MTDKIKSEDFIKAFGSGVKETEHHIITENKGDLISREALKIEIEKQIAYCDDKSKHQSDMEEVLRYSNTSYGLRLAHNYIDNAPTVNPVCWNCVHFGEKAVTGHCIKCRDKDMWEVKKNDRK